MWVKVRRSPAFFSITQLLRPSRDDGPPLKNLSVKGSLVALFPYLDAYVTHQVFIPGTLQKIHQGKMRPFKRRCTVLFTAYTYNIW
jgi:hypothetical protein